MWIRINVPITCVCVHARCSLRDASLGVDPDSLDGIVIPSLSDQIYSAVEPDIRVGLAQELRGNAAMFVPPTRYRGRPDEVGLFGFTTLLLPICFFMCLSSLARYTYLLDKLIARAGKYVDLDLGTKNIHMSLDTK